MKFIYDQKYNESLGGIDVTPELAESSILHMKEFWDDYGTAIEQELLGLTGLSLDNDETCYLNTKITASGKNPNITDKLSLKIEDIEDMIDNFIHEIGHIFFTQNYLKVPEFKMRWDTYMKKYEHEPWLTRTHIMVHALHLLIAQKLFAHRIPNIKAYATHPDYQRAWEIVKEEGAENLIAMLKT